MVSLAHMGPHPVFETLNSAGLGAATAIYNSIGFMSQAYESTAGLIGGTLVALARRPELLRRVEAEPGLLPAVIMEVLRIDAPIQNTRRWVAEDGDIAGRPLKSGDAILVILASANHDPAANPRPDEFDITRADRRCFTFGLGPHACPGERFAVAIASAGVMEFIRRGVDIAALVDGFTYQPSVNARIPIFGGRARSDAS